MTPPCFANANRLLASLSFKDLESLLAKSEPIELHFAEVLYRADEPIAYVYFPTGSFISQVTPIDGSANLEVGLIGNEGMVGIALMLGVEVAPFYALVQRAGSAIRIAKPAFLELLDRLPALQQALKRYVYVLMKQLAQTAACTRFHVLEARLARCLLMMQDRAASDKFHVTHVLLAYILGVRRVGITKAANSLLQQKLINYYRGDVTILNRAGLEAAACECYRVDLKTYENVLGKGLAKDKLISDMCVNERKVM